MIADAPINSSDIEFAVARMFCWRQNIIVPNVWWGMGFNYELDLMVISGSGWATEIEIKISVSDIRADLRKRRWHASIFWVERKSPGTEPHGWLVIFCQLTPCVPA